MTITYRSVSTGAADNALPIVRSIPTGTTTGDYMLMQVSSTGVGVTPTVPAGWALLTSYSPATNRNIFVYGKAVEASEPSTVSVNATGATTLNVGIATVYSSSGLPIALDGVATQDNASSTNRSFPSVTTTRANGMLFCLGSFSAASNSTPDAAMTERWDIGTAVRNYLMTEALGAAGATGTRTATGAAPIASWVITLALGELPLITGNAAITLSAVTLAAAGNVPVAGAASITLSPLTLAASGSVPVTGAGAMTLAPLTVAAAGQLAPLAATGFTATAVDTQSIELEWVHGGVMVDSWQIERSPDGVGGWTLIASPVAADRSFVDDGLLPGVTWYYRIRATNT